MTQLNGNFKDILTLKSSCSGQTTPYALYFSDNIDLHVSDTFVIIVAIKR